MESSTFPIYIYNYIQLTFKLTFNRFHQFSLPTALRGICPAKGERNSPNFQPRCGPKIWAVQGRMN